MRTPVILVTGQGDTAGAADALLRQPGTVMVEHHLEGHFVRRTVARLQRHVVLKVDEILELAHGCVSCTIRNDLLFLLRTLHHRGDVARIVVRLAPWLEPEPICFAINHVRVQIGPGYPVGPAAADVVIAGVVNCAEAAPWLTQALGDDALPDGRTVAQVVVGQAEFADVLLLDEPAPREAAAVLQRLNPNAATVVNTDLLESALASLDGNSRRGHISDAHAWLLAGAPPLEAAGAVQIIEFASRRPFHPQRLHAALDVLLDGVIRTRGRLWLSSQPDHVMWLESAGGGLHTSDAGKWLAAMSDSERAYIDPDRRALANLLWDDVIGDRHTSMVILVCGAEPTAVLAGLSGALLTDAELSDPDSWSGHADPFGDWHVDPCDAVESDQESERLVNPSSRTRDD